MCLNVQECACGAFLDVVGRIKPVAAGISNIRVEMGRVGIEQV